jgi:hypothetical protein
LYSSDDEESCELSQENCDVSGGICSNQSEINVKISSCSERSVNCDEEENVSDSSSKQNGIWAKVLERVFIVLANMA